MLEKTLNKMFGNINLEIKLFYKKYYEHAKLILYITHSIHTQSNHLNIINGKIISLINLRLLHK